MGRVTAFLAVALLLAVPAAAPPAPLPFRPPNLLVNGSFEEGPAVSQHGPLRLGDKRVKGWVVTRGAIDYVGSYWRAANGKRSLDLHGAPGRGGVRQTFKTRPGRVYRVTFALAGNPDGNVPPVRTVRVSAAGDGAEFTFDTSGKTVKAMGWTRKSWRFTAITEETTLEIHTRTKDNQDFGPALDNVSVTEAG